jgi:antibiotic biosynthesis monooxygenase (ABM) superfamily enzyme
MAIMTLLGVYPVSLLLGVTVNKWIGDWSILVRSLIIGVTMVILLTWVMMPLLTRLFKVWLYPDTEKDLMSTQ